MELSARNALGKVTSHSEVKKGFLKVRIRAFRIAPHSGCSWREMWRQYFSPGFQVIKRTFRWESIKSPLIWEALHCTYFQEKLIPVKGMRTPSERI